MIVFKMSAIALISILFLAYILTPIYGVIGVSLSALFAWVVNIFYF